MLPLLYRSQLIPQLPQESSECHVSRMLPCQSFLRASGQLAPWPKLLIDSGSFQ